MNHINLPLAWVGLRLYLGYAPGPQHRRDEYQQKSRNCPAKERLRYRRATLRKNATSQSDTTE